MSKSLRELEDMLCEELDKIVERGSINQTNLDLIHKLTDSLKNVKKIEMCEEKDWSGDDASFRGYGSYSYDGDSRRGYGNDGYSNNDYSRRMYSREDGMMSQIQKMLNDNKLSTDEKATLRRAMQMLNR